MSDPEERLTSSAMRAGESTPAETIDSSTSTQTAAGIAEVERLIGVLLDVDVVEQLIEVARLAIDHLRTPCPAADQARAQAWAISQRLTELIDSIVESRNRQRDAVAQVPGPGGR